MQQHGTSTTHAPAVRVSKCRTGVAMVEQQGNRKAAVNLIRPLRPIMVILFDGSDVGTFLHHDGRRNGGWGEARRLSVSMRRSRRGRRWKDTAGVEIRAHQRAIARDDDGEPISSIRVAVGLRKPSGLPCALAVALLLPLFVMLMFQLRLRSFVGLLDKVSPGSPGPPSHCCFSRHA